MSRSAAPTLAALAAICFWSLTPVFVTIIGDRLNSGEIFVLAAIAGGAVSLVVALIDGPLRRMIFSAGRRESPLDSLHRQGIPPPTDRGMNTDPETRTMTEAFSASRRYAGSIALCLSGVGAVRQPALIP